MQRSWLAPAVLVAALPPPPPPLARCGGLERLRALPPPLVALLLPPPLPPPPPPLALLEFGACSINDSASVRRASGSLVRQLASACCSRWLMTGIAWRPRKWDCAAIMWWTKSLMRTRPPLPPPLRSTWLTMMPSWLRFASFHVFWPSTTRFFFLVPVTTWLPLTTNACE